MNRQSSNDLSKASILPHWDGAIYTRYAAASYDFVTRITGWQAQLKRAALSGLPPEGSFLDIGCGTGFLLKQAKNKGYEVCGIDPSAGMLEKAVLRYDFVLNKDLFCCGADAVPLPDASQDILVCSGSLVHIPELSSVAKEISRLARKGARLRIIDHASPLQSGLLTPFCTLFSQASGDVLHDYEAYFCENFTLIDRVTLGRGGYLQCFDFERKDT